MLDVIREPVEQSLRFGVFLVATKNYEISNVKRPSDWLPVPPPREVCTAADLIMTRKF